jgi:hypothetical protein
MSEWQQLVKKKLAEIKAKGSKGGLKEALKLAKKEYRGNKSSKSAKSSSSKKSRKSRKPRRPRKSRKSRK